MKNPITLESIVSLSILSMISCKEPEDFTKPSSVFIDDNTDEVDTGEVMDTGDEEYKPDLSCKEYDKHINFPSYLEEAVRVPLAIHYVKNDDGSGSEISGLLESWLEKTNSYYVDLNLSFYVASEDEILSSEYISIEAGESLSGLSEYFNDDKIDVFFVESGYHWAGITSPGNYIGLLYSGVQWNTAVFAHELGHYFFVDHTFVRGGELVDGSNCQTDGDTVCDTPADPGVYDEDTNQEGCLYDYITCDNFVCGEDINGETYVPDKNNLMSYYSSSACRDIGYLSIEQKQIIVCSLEEYFDEF